MANTKLYVAYGSNLNLRQMSHRCPNAKVKGKGMLKGYQLTFRGVATIEPDKDAETPVGVWEIDALDERALDYYEGYPRLYRKETVEVEMVDGTKVQAMVYVMNEGKPSLPNKYYYDVIHEGYHDVGLDEKYLHGALADTKKRMGL